MKSEQCHPIWTKSINDDNVVVFITTMKVVATAIIYFTTFTKKYKPQKANFIISIRLLSFQCTHPLVLVTTIHGSSHGIIFNS
jgi:hypothetical protein